MSIQVSFGVVNKAANSTKRGTHSVSLNCNLLEECSVSNPVLLVDISASDLFASGTLNHCYIPTFNRYYFVNNWVWDRAHWRAECGVDVMASYKDEIGASSQYILRCSSEYSGNVLDTKYPILSDYVEYNDSQFSPWDLTNGQYIVGVINALGSVGSISYYAFDETSFGNFCQTLFSYSYVDSSGIMNDMDMETFKAIFNPFQYIVSCTYIPINLYGAVVPNQPVYIGDWNTGMYAYLVTARRKSLGTFGWAWGAAHPEILRGEYVYCAPYTETHLTFLPFGSFTLDPKTVYERNGLYMDVNVDLITGMATLYVGTAASPYLTVQAQVGVPIQIAQVSRDYLNMGVTAISSVANIAKSALALDIGGEISNIASGIDSAIRSQVPRLQTMGANGSFANLMENPVFTKRYYYMAAEDNTNLGRPLAEIRTISSLSGFILCEGAKVDCPGTFDENKAVQDIMNSGFFYE